MTRLLNSRMDPAYRCKLCDYFTDWKDSCVKHMQSKHPELVKEQTSKHHLLGRYKESNDMIFTGSFSYRCKRCDYVTDTRDSCVKHMQAKHPELGKEQTSKNHLLERYKK